MEGTKHAKVVEDVLNKKGFVTSTLLTRQKGKPSTSSKGVLKKPGEFVSMVKLKQIYEY